MAKRSRLLISERGAVIRALRAKISEQKARRRALQIEKEQTNRMLQLDKEEANANRRAQVDPPTL